MDKEGESIKKFCDSFFINLGALPRWEGDILFIEGVPKVFEDFCGKKSPYYLAFDKVSGERVSNSELMTRGSYLLRSMSEFLENKGQTALIKLVFNVETNDIKDYLKLNNCKIERVSKVECNSFFARFTFLTIFQYLNEKEQKVNSICFDRSGKVDFDVSKCQTIDGKKNEILIGDIKPLYEMAKIEVKSCIKPQIEEISRLLKIKLQKEIERVKGHYDHQINEIDDKIKSSEKQISDLESGNTNGDLKNIPARINKLTEQINELKNGDNRNILVKERDFFINDETNKHSLSLDNKLINTTIFYYPIYKFKTFLKSIEGGREIELEYNPIKKEITKLNCEVCNKEITAISLCSSGHISCESCITKCPDCQKDYCKECLSRSCDLCGKKLCKRCVKKCFKCGKNCCSSHIRKASIGEVCINCMVGCPSCGQSVNKLVRCPSCGRQLCENCSKREFVNSGGKISCTSCTKMCLSCGKYFDRSHFNKCTVCNLKQCNYPGKCLSCRNQLCAKLRRS